VQSPQSTCRAVASEATEVTVYLALLRGINVGGNKMVAMADLRALLTQLDFVDPKSLLQSGNLVFRSPRRKTGAQLERLLEVEVEARLGLQVSILVRTAAEWQAVLEQNPFPKEAKSDPSRLLVLFLKDAPATGAVEALQAAIKGPEVVRARGKEAYLVYPDGMGRSRLTHAQIEKRLGRGTARNWNTVVKLGAMSHE
jgi:uncharacterized protein (DUF1697 family)